MNIREIIQEHYSELITNSTLVDLAGLTIILHAIKRSSGVIVSLEEIGMAGLFQSLDRTVAVVNAVRRSESRRLAAELASIQLLDAAEITGRKRFLLQQFAKIEQEFNGD